LAHGDFLDRSRFAFFALEIAKKALGVWDRGNLMAVSLVTGGSGFIGSHLVEALVDRGDHVRVLDDFSTGSAANLFHVKEKIEVVDGDVTNPIDVRLAMKNVELVFHHAALTPSPSKPIDPLLIHHVVATGTLHVLQAACEVGARRVIFAGSASVYRSDDDQPRQESDTTLPRSLYAIAKLTAEDYCAAFHQVYGLDTVRLRYFNVFGPRFSFDGLHDETVANLLQTMRSGRKPILKGDGRQKRDFTHVNDISQANILAAEAPRVAGKVYNIATGQATSLLDLVEIINHLLGTKLQAVLDRASEEGPRNLWANIVQAQTELGFCPCTDLRRDLESCLVKKPEQPEGASQMRWDGLHVVANHRHAERLTEMSLAKKVNP
jgi:UDP-glucose 4-epimerase